MKQTQALKIAIKALEKQRRIHSPGKAMYLQGFESAENEYKRYIECDQAIRQLEDLIEILEDPIPLVRTAEQLSFIQGD
jgi:hypothetical protein